jgi:3-phenylpropionate/trans-cinnamate dioxygenase ferredoxin reductase subunit
MRRIVVVGASLAGVAASETLRRHGFDGKLFLIGDEPHLPYDRPPLSKEHLAGVIDDDAVRLRPAEWADTNQLELIIGARAVGLDLQTRSIALRDGTDVPFDGLVIATGAAPVPLPGTPVLENVFMLRTLDDARRLRAALQPGVRVAIVGGGFIGAEIAATLQGGSISCTIIESLPAPLSRILGLGFGEAIADLHRQHGVRVVCGVPVAGLEDLGGRVTGVRLADGGVVPADIVVIGIGVRPSTGWLAGSGLELGDGVVCDSRCRTAAPGVTAAGDVARWEHPALGSIRLEHWENAVGQGEAAALALLDGDAAPEYAPVPYVWSDQYGRKIQIVGWPDPGDDLVIIDGALDQTRCFAVYGRAGRLVAAVGIGRARLVRQARQLLSRPVSLSAAIDQLGMSGAALATGRD